MAKLNSGTRIYGNVTIDTFVTATGNIQGGNLVTGGILSVTGNANVGNIGAAAGVFTTVAGTLTTAAQPNITSTGTLTSVSVSGNATAGNLNTAGAVVASTLTSNVAIGTAPLTVTSTTRVANLNVNYANVADFISVAAGTGNNFLIFANAATGNITELTSTGLTANLSNNSITATTFVGALSGAATSATTAGTVTTAAQPNITSVGTLTSISVSGNANIGNIGTAGLITATGNISGGNISTAGQLNVTGVATAGGAVLEIFNIGGTNIALYGGGTALSGRTILGWNRTSGGGEFDIITNRNGGSTGGVRFYDWSNTLSNTTTEIFSVTGTGAVTTPSTISATGNITGSNVTVTGYHFRSVGTSISAAGSTQGTATAISKEINVVSTVASGAGVVLPTAVAGMAITITNTSANSLLVYPATSGIINSLSANAGYTQPAGATLQFVAPTTTQWYTIGATYV